ncbi:DUF4382 domain-containing protein [Salinigranum marinum]|uniref:DUF4382 domain-containing protein n=1 Tax=Salinigranum marinum TaxID=1515595 RepID=UPI002989A9C9|nr:DUF4382 domain-containing protein [Salinigranum marinum]
MNSRITALVVVIVLVAGCTGSPGGRDLEGSVDVYVGNQGQPVEGFAHLNVTVSDVSFVPGDRANGDPNTPANGTETQRFDRTVNRTTVDLTTVQGDSAAFVDTVALPVREEYTTVVLTVTDVEATLASGERANVTLPGGTLNVSTGFGVEPDTETALLLDVSASEGDNGTYTLAPVDARTGLNLTTPAATGAGSSADATGTNGGQGQEQEQSQTAGTGTATAAEAANGTETTSTNTAES